MLIKKLQYIKHYCVVFVVFLLFSCQARKQATNYFGIETRNSSRIIFLVDISGSMIGGGEKGLNLTGEDMLKSGVEIVANIVLDEVLDIPGYVSLFKRKSRLNKFGIVEKELTAAINGLDEVNNFTIITFNSKIRKWRNSLVPANERNKFNAVSFVKEIYPRGETNIYNVLKEAFKISERENNNVTFFLLTDGVPSMGQIKRPEALLEIINEWNTDNKVTIHTISLGDGTDKDFLQNVANENNGRFIER